MTAVRAHEILSVIDAAVRSRSPIEAVLEILDRSKHPLFDELRARFDSIAAQALTLKILNLCLAKYDFLARSPHLLSRPFGLIADPSNGCNLACPGCVHSRYVKERGFFDWQKGMLPESLLDGLLKRYGPYAIQMTLYNYGEPLINPETPRFIRMAKRYLMQTVISTNFSIGRFDAEAYVESGLDFIVLSIDGATQPAYERFRKNGNLELVYTNIRKLVHAKRALGRHKPVIEWQFLAFEHNAHEIPMPIGIPRRLVVNQCAVRPPLDVSCDDPTIRPAEIEPVVKIFDWNSEDAMIKNWNPFPAALEARTIVRELGPRLSDLAALLPKKDRY